MTRAPLPRSWVWIVRRVVPSDRSADVLGDLADDFARIRARRSAVAARLWLARETMSVLVAYAGAPLRRLPILVMVWGRDARSAWRGLRRAPLASVSGTAMLAAGLLALLVTGGLTHTLLFRRVSATHGDALHRVTTVDRQGRVSQRFSFVELQRLADHMQGHATLSTVSLQPVVVRAANTNTQTLAEVVDGRYFSLTGIGVRLGRGLMSADDDPAGTPVAVVSESFWRSRFGASPTALGQIVDLNGAAFTIVGIADTLGSSSFFGASVDVWLPIGHGDAVLARDWRTNTSERLFTAYALPDRDRAALEVALAGAATSLARDLPETWRERRLQTAVATVLTGTQRSSAMLLAPVLGGLALLILTTAASNLGGVILARAAATRRQVAIHLAMGSGRSAIIRRHLFEGALQGLLAAALALGGYAWARTLFTEVSLLPTLALRLDLPLHSTLVTLVATAGVIAGILLAVGPALWASRVVAIEAMRDGDPRSSSRGLTRARRVLVAAQVALSLALVVGAALFSRTLTALIDADLGFPRAQLIAMDFDLEPSSPPASALPALARDALDRARALPGIRAAAMSSRAPVDQSTPAIDVRAATRDGVLLSDVTFYLATAAYFDTVGIPLIAGRGFSTAESESRADVVVVNAALAAALGPRGDAIDRTIYVTDTPLRVVGVARDAKYRTITESGRPHFYRPTPPALGLTLLARTADDPRAALRALQQTLDTVGPGLVGFFPRTLDDHLAIELLPTRAAAAAATGLSAVALVFSGSGLFGLVSWFVAMRSREIGIRLALGASAGSIRALVVGHAVRTALPGLIAGAFLAVALALLARTALFGVAPLDPAAFAAGIVAVVMVVAAAAYGPSRRASHIDAASLLRD